MSFETNLNKVSMHADTRRAIHELFEGIRVEKIISRRFDARKGVLYFEGFDHLHEIRLDGIEEVFIMGFGKASSQMAKAFLPVLSKAYSGRMAGQIITKYGHGVPCDPLEVLEAGHPNPDLQSVEATDRLMNHLLERRGQPVLLFAFVSGGASSMLVSPVDGVSLEDLIKTNEALLRSGADIREINAIRKHLSKVKGGRLAQLVSPLPFYVFILSDVVGDDLGSVGSGPTVLDRTTYGFCLETIRRYELESQMPSSVLNYLKLGREGVHPETPKEGSCTVSAQNWIVGNLEIALKMLCSSFERLGYKVIHVDRPVVGLNSEAVAAHVKRLLSLRNDRLLNGIFCMISGGETTVRVRGSGFGGRNTEFAVECGLRLYEEGFRGFEAVSMGTDGTDGPTDAAGGIVTDSMLGSSEIREQAKRSLENNDTYHFLESTGGLLKTGPTGTNVNDIHFIIIR